MKVYAWEETDNHWLAVMRPAGLFDLSTRTPTEFHPGYKEGTQKARHRISGMMEPFAYVWNKQFGVNSQDRRAVEVRMADRSDRYLEADQRDLRVGA